MEKNFGDDFEFKPLTEGLGFHKKVIDLREESAGKIERPGFGPGFNPGFNIEKIPHPKRPTFENPVNKESKPPTSLPINSTWIPALKNATLIDSPISVTKAHGLERLV